MAELEMSSASTTTVRFFPYHKLIKYSNEEEFDRDQLIGSSSSSSSSSLDRFFGQMRMRMRYSSSSSSRTNSSSNNWFSRFRIINSRKRSRMKMKVVKIRKLMVRKKCLKMISSVRKFLSKILKRFKDGEDYLGDIFSGNYLFLQVNPSYLTTFDHLKKQYAHQNNYSLSPKFA